MSEYLNEDKVRTRLERKMLEEMARGNVTSLRAMRQVMRALDIDSRNSWINEDEKLTERTLTLQEEEEVKKEQLASIMKYARNEQEERGYTRKNALKKYDN